MHSSMQPHQSRMIGVLIYQQRQKILCTLISNLTSRQLSLDTISLLL